jgi:2-iminobutanoate/2-iminopropanoate deaminase
MNGRVIHTDKAPQAVGPYSQAVVAGGLIFTSGQVALDPESGKLVDGGVQEQTRQVMENLGSVLSAAGSGFSEVVKATVYLHDIGHFAEVNKVYREYFSDEPPARTAFQVGALPLGALVEIEMIAHKE